MNEIEQKDYMIPKQKSSAGVLLGTGGDGTEYWLALPSWDWDRYWGFGYIWSKHSCMDWWRVSDSSDKESARLQKTTFTDKEGLVLCELFQTFYQLKKQAELTGRGGMHFTSNPCKDLLVDTSYSAYVNEILIPAVTKEIISILTPNEHE